MTDPYRPINCEFHDILEAVATRRTTAVVVYLDDEGLPREVSAVIEDLGAREHVEFMRLGTSSSTALDIRLDRIVSVNGVRLTDFQAP